MLRARPVAPSGLRRSTAILGAGILISLTAGCGGATAPRVSGPSSAAAIAHRVFARSCAVSMSGNDSHEVGFCELVLLDGRRFRCPLASVLASPTQIERSKKCHVLPRSSPAALPAVLAAIAKARSCLRRAALTVTGGP